MTIIQKNSSIQTSIKEYATFCTGYSSLIQNHHGSSPPADLQLSRGVTGGGDLIVEQTGQEVGVILTGDLASEVTSSKLELVAPGALGGQFVGLLLQKTQGVGLVDLLAVRGGDAVVRPLPELRAGDFGGGRVLLFFVSFCVFN